MLLLDKPRGITSNGALQVVKRLYQAQKAGHTGSLDPIATGLLPLCLGEATKISGFFLDADKSYDTRLKFGETTDSGDADGLVTLRRPVTVSEAQIESAVARFRGEFDQIPPMFSAVKQGGTPLYKLARQGIEVERAPRRVRVHRLEWRRVDNDHLDLTIRCSSGFYVRGLAHELGEALGCGAHVESLRRTEVGALRVEDSVPLERLESLARDELDSLLLPLDLALAHLPEVRISDLAAFYLCRGQPVRVSAGTAAGWLRIYGESAGFLGIGESTGDGQVAPRRLFHLVPAVAAPR
jgi:tRNA pseudouridine55 synthase